MSELGASAMAALTALVGESGVIEDSAMLAAQFRRAIGILDAPEIAEASLFGVEPSSHAAALVRLAPQDAR